MGNWDPPQAGGTPEIPLTAVETPARWWKRKYRRVPVWGWATGGIIALSAVSAAFAPDESGQLATSDSAASTTVDVNTFADVESAPSTPDPAATSQPPMPTLVTIPPTTFPPATTIATQPTNPPTTTSPPTTILVVTLPPTTTSPPTTIPATTVAPTTVAATTVPLPSGPSVDIAIRFDADGNDNQNKNDEWVRFINSGSSTLDMTGWVVEDEGPNHMYRFGALVLQPGESVTLFSGCGNDDALNRYWCNSGSAIWNNDGDTVTLYDSNGALVLQRSG